MGIKFTNFAVTTLASGISAASTSLSVVLGTGAAFPTLAGGDYFYATLIQSSTVREVVKVTARSSDTFTITRAQEGTTALIFGAGTVIELRLTAAALTDASLITTALGYTPYNATNPSGYTTNLGTVTSVSGTGTVSGLTLTGSVTSSGSLTLGGTLSLTSAQVTTALTYTPLSTAGGNVTGNLVVGGSTQLQSARLSVSDTSLKTATANNIVLGTATGGVNDFQLVVGRSAAGTNGYWALQSVEQGIGYRDIVLQKDGGNLGVGTGGLSWSTGNVAIQIGSSGHVTGATSLTLSTNTYYNAGWKFFNTGRVTQYAQAAGAHTWSNSASGTADGAATLITQMSLDVSGNLVATANVTAYSDERLKKDWLDLPVDFIERLADVKHGTYTRIDSGLRQVGASAQAFLPLLPEGVHEGEEYLSLAYGNIALVSSIQLARRVVELERRLVALEK